MATEILCRYDAAQQKGVVFLRDSINNNQVQVWDGQGNPAYKPLDYYHMTRPLSAEDERVLMERFKSSTGRQDQVVRLNHRLPRTSRALPNVLAAAQGTQAINGQRKSKPIEMQSAPTAPAGDLPQGDEKPAPMPTTQQANAPVAGELASASLFRRIQELNAHISKLNETITSLDTELQKATTDYEASKVACKELVSELEAALDDEAMVEARKRKEMLSSLTASIPALSTLAQAAQELHNAETAPTPPKAEEPTKAPVKARSTGGRFASKGNAPAKSH